MIDREKVIKGLEEFKIDLRQVAGNQADWDKFDDGFILLNKLNQQAKNWESLRITIEEMRDNGGAGTQQGVCRFLANLMDVLEKREATPWQS